MAKITRSASRKRSINIRGLDIEFPAHGDIYELPEASAKPAPSLGELTPAQVRVPVNFDAAADHGQLDHSAVATSVVYDNRFNYNPPAIVAPAISQEQFDYDNQREIEANLLSSPGVLGYVLQDLKDKIRIIEERLEQETRNERRDEPL